MLQDYDPENRTISYAGNCYICRKRVIVERLRVIDWVEWDTTRGTTKYRGVERIFHYLTDGEREFLISQTCEPCFDKMTLPEE